MHEEIEHVRTEELPDIVETLNRLIDTVNELTAQQQRREGTPYEIQAVPDDNRGGLAEVREALNQVIYSIGEQQWTR